jgi:hypothetical protein
MAKTIEQQIADEKARLKKIADDAAALTAAAESSKASKASTTATRKKIAELQSKLDYISDRIKPYIKRVAAGEKLGATDKSIFDGLSDQFDTVKEEISQTSFPGAAKTDRTAGTTASGPDAAKAANTPGAPTTATNAGTPAPAPAPAPTTTPKPKPAVKPKPDEPAKVETPVDREAEALNAAAGTDFALPETLFKNIPSLNALLKKYVSTPGMTPDAFRKMLRDDVWYKQNSKEIKERFVQYYNYRDLQASGRAQGTTDYEMQIDKIEAKLKKRAVEIGSAAASDPAALRKAAENLYITNRSEDESFIDDFLAASIRTVGGIIGGKGTEGYTGQALTNYQELVRTARSNGFQVSDIIPGGANEQQVLQGIASGKLDINRIIQDTRKLAAQGQPQYVRDLLSQGYNLDQVFAPYRQTMAAVLEIDDPKSIDLNDPLLRSAISDKGDMNVYDFKKALRKDNRWQYTEQARQDVSAATLDILRDFGFQG